MRKIAILLITVLLAFTSCMSPDDVQIVSCDNVEILSPSRVNLTFTVENKSKKDIKVSDIRLIVSQDGTDILKVFAEEEITIKKRSKEEIMVPLRMRLTNLGSILSMALTEEVEDLQESITGRGEATLSIGRRSRRFTFDNLSLENSSLLQMIEERALQD